MAALISTRGLASPRAFLLLRPRSTFSSTPTRPPVRLGCRAFTTTPAPLAGHNKWSKIRHEKGATDRKVASQRQILTKNITLFSRLYGPDVNLNSQLADAIVLAKKSNMPKATIEAAIARGQGRSSTGAQLESVMLEIMTPPEAGSVALIIHVETDNRNRTLHELRHLAKKHGASVAPTQFLFERKGRTVLSGVVKADKAPKTSSTASLETERAVVDFDAAFMQAVEAGAEDVEQDEDGNIIVWTQPNMTHQIAQGLAKAMAVDILWTEIIWTSSADKAQIDGAEAAQALGGFLEAVRENSDVQAVYSNAEKGTVSDDLWDAVEDHLDS